MSATVTPINLTIHALRIDNKKVSTGLFSQFNERPLLSNIGWPDIFYEEDPVPGSRSLKSFTIIGRHSYKVTPEEENATPFLYCINHEISKSTLEDLLDEGRRQLEALHSNYVKPIKRYIEIAEELRADPVSGIRQLAEKHKLSNDSFSDPFFDWEPSFLDQAPYAVVINGIQKKVMSDYEEVATRLLVTDWKEDVLHRELKEERQRTIKQLEGSINEHKVDTLILQWFSLNQELLEKEYTEAKAFYKEHEADLARMEGQVLSSPKVYIGV